MRVTRCPPNRRTKSPLAWKRLRRTRDLLVDLAVQAGYSPHWAHAVALEIIRTGSIPLVFGAKPARIPPMVARYSDAFIVENLYYAP